MNNLIKAEFRKLITVRSTYVILGLSVFFLFLSAFLAGGYRASGASLLDKSYFYNQSQQAILLVGLLGSLVGILLMTHEYRYNTITYTLTAAKSRTQVLLAKLVVVSVFAVLFSLFIGTLAPLLVWFGVHAKGSNLIPQHINLIRLLWHDLFVGWAYCTLAFTFAVIIRAQVGAISALFLIPALIEPLLGLILRKNAIYFPYNAMQSIIESNPSLTHISSGRTVIVVLAYVVVGSSIGWLLFLRRDATS